MASVAELEVLIMVVMAEALADTLADTLGTCLGDGVSIGKVSESRHDSDEGADLEHVDLCVGRNLNNPINVIQGRYQLLDCGPLI